MANGEPEMSVEDFLFVPWILEKRCSVSMDANQSCSIKLLVKSRRKLETDEPTPHSAKLCFLEEFSDKAAIEEGARAGSQADVSIVFAGRTAEWESEGSDLVDLKLPNNQDQLIKAVAKASSKTVVVLNGGNPFDVSEWIDDVDAVIFAQYPGQEGGAALADILTGVVNPSGRLPMSWPKNLEDTPTFGNFPSIKEDSGITLNYKEGVKIGYRHYWNESGGSSARWDFGYGLSYTQFVLGDLKLDRKVTKGEDTMIELEFMVENIGSMAGAEVVQVFVEDVETSVWRPRKELKAFEKVFLQSKEKKLVKIRMVEKYALSFWDERSNEWLAEKGTFNVHVRNLVVPLVLQDSFRWVGL
jgi:beta-glucosidase